MIRAHGQQDLPLRPTQGKEIVVSLQRFTGMRAFVAAVMTLGFIVFTTAVNLGWTKLGTANPLIARQSDRESLAKAEENQSVLLDLRPVPETLAPPAIERAMEEMDLGNFQDARAIIEPLVSQKHSGARLLWGDLLANGWGVPRKDPVEAVRYYEMAAHHGCAMAQYRLGNAYSLGVGVPLDFVRAWAWYGLASTQIQAAVRFQKLIGGNMNADQISDARSRQKILQKSIVLSPYEEDREGCSPTIKNNP